MPEMEKLVDLPELVKCPLCGSARVRLETSESHQRKGVQLIWECRDCMKRWALKIKPAKQNVWMETGEVEQWTRVE